MKRKKASQSKSSQTVRRKKAASRPKSRLKRLDLPSRIQTLPGRLKTERLVEFLRECLMTEQATSEIYATLLRKSKDLGIKEQLRFFLEKTEHLSDLLETAIRDLGGNPRAAKPESEIRLQKINAILFSPDSSSDPILSELESLSICQMLCHHHWELLSEARPFVDDPHAMDILLRIVDEGETEENEQLQWSLRALSRRMLESLLETGPSTKAA